MDKPEACQGCPFFQDGKGFVPDEINPDAKVLIIAQNPGENEEEKARPMVGRTGVMMQGWLTPLGLRREQLSLANVIKCRWQRKNYLPEKKTGGFAEITLQAAEHCQKAYLQETLKKATPHVTALLGELALNTVAKREGTGSWRGSVWIGPKQRKFMALSHPASLFSAPRLRTAMRQDFARLARESRRPEMEVVYSDVFYQAVGVDEFIHLLANLGQSVQRRVALDIETSYAKAVEASLRTIGIGWGKDTAANIDFAGLDAAERVRVIEALSAFPGEWITATPFDYAVLRKYGVEFNWEKCHDLTLLHSRFDIELPHTLDFIASMWTERPHWKYLSVSAPYRYNCLDCAGEYEAFVKLWLHCKVKDPLVLKCYEADRKLTKVAVEFMLNGLPYSPTAYEAERAYYGVIRKELEGEVSASFAPRTAESEFRRSLRCERHPRYTGKSPIGKRKNESSPCIDCQAIRQNTLSRKPLNLRSGQQLARRLREEGMQVGDSMDKGSVAKLAKRYNDPRLMRYLEFKQKDTIVTRYFTNPQVTKKTERIHSTYSMHAAKHRWSSNGPNAQQFARPED